MSTQLSEGYTAAILITQTAPITAEHETLEEAREWLTATLTGLTSGSDASFANEATSALLVDNISDRTLDQWDGGAAQVAAQLRRETTPTIQTVDVTDPQWTVELDRPYIQDAQLHSEIAGQYVTFTCRGIRWQLAPDASGDTAALVLSRDYRLTYPWSEDLPEVERAEHHIHAEIVRDAVNEAIQIIDNHPL